MALTGNTGNKGGLKSTVLRYVVCTHTDNSD